MDGGKDVGDQPPKLYQGRLHGVLAFPVGETGELLGVDEAVARVDTGEVDLADEPDGRRLVGVLVAAVHLYRVDAVLVDGLPRFSFRLRERRAPGAGANERLQEGNTSNIREGALGWCHSSPT